MVSLRGQSHSYFGSGTPTHNHFEFSGGLDESSVDNNGNHKEVTGIKFAVNNANAVRAGTYVKIYGLV